MTSGTFQALFVLLATKGGPQAPLWLGIIIMIVVVAAIVITQVRRR